MDAFGIEIELEFRLGKCRAKRKALHKLIEKLAEVKMIENSLNH